MLTIKGNQQIVKKEYAVSSFLQLHLSVSGLVELHQSAEEKVEVEADENLLGCIDVMNAGKTLFITSEAGIRKPDFSSLTVRIYFRQLTKLSINCEEAEVISKSAISLLTPLEIKIGGICNAFLNLDIPVCKLLIQNQGNVTLSGKCTVAEIKTQAEGNLLAKELLVQDLKLKNRSEGNVEVFADNTISISHYGEGFVHYYGNARLSDINQRGDGEVKHLD